MLKDLENHLLDWWGITPEDYGILGIVLGVLIPVLGWLKVYKLFFAPIPSLREKQARLKDVWKDFYPIPYYKKVLQHFWCLLAGYIFWGLSCLSLFFIVIFFLAGTINFVVICSLFWLVAWSIAWGCQRWAPAEKMKREEVYYE